MAAATTTNSRMRLRAMFSLRPDGLGGSLCAPAARRLQWPMRRIALRIRSICLTNPAQHGHLRRCSRTRTSSISLRSRSSASEMTRWACLQVRRRNEAVMASALSFRTEPAEPEALPQPPAGPVRHYKGIRRRDAGFLTYLPARNLERRCPWPGQDLLARHRRVAQAPDEARGVPAPTLHRLQVGVKLV